MVNGISLCMHCDSRFCRCTVVYIILVIDQPSNQRQSRLPSAVDDDDDSIAYDPLNLETCKAFVDAKKKLRLVLSTLDPQMVPMTHGVMPQRTHHHHDNELIAFLQILLAEALNLQDHDAIAQLHETIRCLRQFETHEYVVLKNSLFHLEVLILFIGRIYISSI